jgi:D-alanyl-D-alanine carboxypeptidase (penicillin-binding protein 5/6)
MASKKMLARQMDFGEFIFYQYTTLYYTIPMILASLVVTAVGCLVANQPLASCWEQYMAPSAQAQSAHLPYFSGTAISPILSAQAYTSWDVSTGTSLAESNADVQRPIASISKLLSLLAVRQLLSPDQVVAIPPDVRAAQAAGANIKLPVGEHAKVSDLIAAALIPSANDAMVTLAVAAKGSEQAFVDYANQYALQHDLPNTHLANSTGLQGGVQYSTAHDVQKLLTMVYADPVLRQYVDQQAGDLVTVEGTKEHYISTDQLLGTYLPVLAAKTGYTIQAGENLTLLTVGPAGQKIGVVVLGSQDRFYDAKVLIAWIWRNFTW